ncbi:YHYH domain-containing protein [Aminipila terrae]|uniref:YHYH domain-containing protein n=1 Tax=Aminipila terrae TaxID=2697030 RepID=A0A6P1MLC6_9FIRM|nr:YHYH domain-containing protein [Aminipila terrae]QHI72868.1 YHYH domain-containing protein [Aminipila terrae]
MKKKKLLHVIVIIALCICMPVVVLAHSGRTDSAGGHHDYKNVSGLGSYHYHCGGHPAHLHKNGVCPYSSSSVAKSTTKSVTTTNYNKPSFPVVVNGTNLNNTTSNYGPVVINDVTYVPLSSEVIKALGLTGGWVDSNTGLVLNSN